MLIVDLSTFFPVELRSVTAEHPPQGIVVAAHESPTHRLSIEKHNAATYLLQQDIPFQLFGVHETYSMRELPAIMRSYDAALGVTTRLLSAFQYKSHLVVTRFGDIVTTLPPDRSPIHASDEEIALYHVMIEAMPQRHVPRILEQTGIVGLSIAIETIRSGYPVDPVLPVYAKRQFVRGAIANPGKNIWNKIVAPVLRESCVAFCAPTVTFGGKQLPDDWSTPR